MRGERLKGANSYLVKTLLYFSVDKSALNVRFPDEDWYRGYAILTEDTLYVQSRGKPYDIAAPLSHVAKARRLKGKIHSRLFHSANFMAGLLEVCCPNNNVRSILLAGPKNMMSPFWDLLIHRLRKVRIKDELKDLKRMLYTLYLGVRDLKSIGFILNMEKEKLLVYLYRLYREGLIERSGRLTQRGLQEISEVERYRGIPLNLEEIFSLYRLFNVQGKEALMKDFPFEKP
jgi:hypothetical protein